MILCPILKLISGYKCHHTCVLVPTSTTLYFNTNLELPVIGICDKSCDRSRDKSCDSHVTSHVIGM